MSFRISNQVHTVWEERLTSSQLHDSRFAAALEREKKTAETPRVDMPKEEALEKLSASAKSTLEKLKSHSPSVGKEEWMHLLNELKNLGLITQQESFLAAPGTMLIPFVSYDGGKTYQLAHIPDEIRNAMNQNETWPCDPLAYYDALEFLLRKWNDYLLLQIKSQCEPTYEGLAPIQGQADACSRVSSLVRSLMEKC